MASRGVTLGRTQAPRISVPSEIFSVYQAEIGHLAAILWLNLRWSAHVGNDFSLRDAPRYGIHESDDQLYQALQTLKEYALLEDGPNGEWIVHEPLAEDLFYLRFGKNSAVTKGMGAPEVLSIAKPAATAATKEGADSGGEERKNGAARVMRSPLSKKRARAHMLKLVDEQVDGAELTNEDMQAVVQIYHKRIGMMGPTQYEKLRFWVEEQGMEGAVVALAIEETVASAEVPRIEYLEGILRNWYNDGIRTLAHVQESKRASKVFSKSGDGAGAARSHEGTANASAYQSVNPELVEKWKELYPDEYDG